MNLIRRRNPFKVPVCNLFLKLADNLLELSKSQIGEFSFFKGSSTEKRAAFCAINGGPVNPKLNGKVDLIVQFPNRVLELSGLASPITTFPSRRTSRFGSSNRKVI